MQILVKLILNTLTVLAAAYIVPGIVIIDLLTAGVVAIALGVVNLFVKPIIHLVSLPLTILTLGLFSLVINGLMVLLVSAFVPGFEVRGLLSAILFSLAVSFIGAFLNNLT